MIVIFKKERKAMKKIFRKLKSRNFFILNSIAILIFCLIFSSVSCAAVSRIIQDSLKKAQDTNTTLKAGSSDNRQEENDVDKESEKTESTLEAGTAIENNLKDQLVYLEITSDPLSNHFEHRVLNIYSSLADGTDKELVYSDINEKYDLGQVFSISPDNKKIACKIVEGGRGAYSALAVIDIESLSLKILEEYDYTEVEEYLNAVDLYSKLIWTQDSRFLLYEKIQGSNTSNTRDVGIFKVDVGTGEITKIELDVMGASLRSTLFLAPLFNFAQDSKLACVFHPYYPIEEDGEVIGFYTVNEGLSYVDISNGEIVEMFYKSGLEGLQGAPEIISSFDNFIYLPGLEKLIFQVLGDFEEDGDIWVYDIAASSFERITSDSNLREQQPDVYNETTQNPLIAYIGSNRYGTISSQIPSGDVYITDFGGENTVKLTDYGIGAFKPMFSDDGKKIGYLRAVYDENFEYITGYNLESVDIESREITIAASAGYLDFIGWID